MRIKDIKSKQVREEAIKEANLEMPWLNYEQLKNLDLNISFTWEKPLFWIYLYHNIIENTPDLKLPTNE